MAFEAGSVRYVFIDALRGVAAIGVLLHHLLHNTVLEKTLRTVLPNTVQWLFMFGARGVQVFFVLSGFVIAHSLRHTVPSRQTVFNFALRRQLRLDPAYWTMIAFALAVWAIERNIPSLSTEPLPSFANIGANAFYLHNILGVPHILGVAWTLCIEIQFYVVFIALLWVTFALRGYRFEGLPKFAGPMVALLGLVSLNVPSWSVKSPWFITFWCYFSGGVLCYWAVTRQIPRWLLFSYLLVMTVATVRHGGQPMLVGLATTAGIWLLGECNKLITWSCGSVIQYFGRISYSLYLVHLTIAPAILRLGYKLTNDNGPAALMWMLAGGIASIAVAHVFYVLIESPSILLASRIKRTTSNEDTSRLRATPSRDEAPTTQELVETA